MLFSMTQTVLLVAVAAFFVYWQISVHRRNRQSWESLFARLNPEFNFRTLSQHFPWKEGLSATPDEAWDRMHGVKGLLAIYRNAGVMLEIANFAFRNADNVDMELVRTIHVNAVQIRFCILATIARCIISQGTEAVRFNSFRAASMYTGLAAHITDLLQSSASNVLPAFVAAA